jgi:serine/threonine protein kinase
MQKLIEVVIPVSLVYSADPRITYTPHEFVSIGTFGIVIRYKIHVVQRKSIVGPMDTFPECIILKAFHFFNTDPFSEVDVIRHIEKLGRTKSAKRAKLDTNDVFLKVYEPIVQATCLSNYENSYVLMENCTNTITYFRGRLNENVTAHFCLRIAKCIHQCIQNGLYYLDLSSTNIMYQCVENGEMRLLLGDLGSFCTRVYDTGASTYPCPYGFDRHSPAVGSVVVNEENVCFGLCVLAGLLHEDAQTAALWGDLFSYSKQYNMNVPAPNRTVKWFEETQVKTEARMKELILKSEWTEAFKELVQQLYRTNCSDAIKHLEAFCVMS